MFQTKVVEKIKTHILCSVIPPPKKKNCAIYEIRWQKWAGPATDDSMAHSHYMLDTKATNTHIICITYHFSRAVVVRMHLNVMLFVHCLSCEV